MARGRLGVRRLVARHGTRVYTVSLPELAALAYGLKQESCTYFSAKAVKTNRNDLSAREKSFGRTCRLRSMNCSEQNKVTCKRLGAGTEAQP